MSGLDGASGLEGQEESPGVGGRGIVQTRAPPETFYQGAGEHRWGLQRQGLSSYGNLATPTFICP